MVAMATNAPEGVDEALSEPSSPLKDLTSAVQKDATDGLTPQPSNSKIDVLLKATGDAPIMTKRKWAVDRAKKVAWVIEFVRKYLKLEGQESLFLYVNQSFAPAPDVNVGTLFDCFGTDGKLVLHYCRTQAWG